MGGGCTLHEELLIVDMEMGKGFQRSSYAHSFSIKAQMYDFHFIVGLSQWIAVA